MTRRVHHPLQRRRRHKRLQGFVGSGASLRAVGPDVHALLDLGVAGRLDGELVATR